MDWDQSAAWVWSQLGQSIALPALSVSSQALSLSRWHLQNVSRMMSSLKALSALTVIILQFLAHPAFFPMTVPDNRQNGPISPALNHSPLGNKHHALAL